MKTRRLSLSILVLVVSAMGLCGCSLFRHHQPKSSFKIIQDGDDNPFIHDDPTRAGEEQRTVEVRKY